MFRNGPMQMADAITPVRRFGRYEIREVLGRGGMGVVYRGYDSLLDREVAVKTYRRGSDIEDELRSRFERELRTASGLNHSNIVAVYDGGLEDDVPFIAMELVDGPTLDEVLRSRGKLPAREAVAILRGIAAGLEYAHAHGVLHRDLKPSNILLSSTGMAKIADFGVAKVMQGDPSATTTQLLGTPTRMSPEQIRGETLTAGSDVFALGALAYELLTGREPFGGSSMPAAMHNVLSQEPPPPSALEPSLPKSLDAVVERALAKNLAGRTPDVATFARELQAAVSVREDASATTAMPVPSPETIPDRGLGAETLDLASLRGFAREPSVGVSRRTAIGAAAALVLCAGVMGGFFATRASRGNGTAVVVTRSTEGPAAAVVQTDVGTANGKRSAVTVTAEPVPNPAVVARTEEPPAAAPIVEAAARPAPSKAVLPLPPKRQPVSAPAPIRAVARTAPAAATISPLLAAIEVRSEPIGAEIVIDGVSRGRTPSTVRGLSPGEHAFEVRKDGFVPYRAALDVVGRSVYSVDVKLPARLRPPSTVVSAAAAPLGGPSVAEAASPPMVPDLPRATNSLYVLSRPGGAPVTINGVRQGQTPLRLDRLADGTYAVTVELPQVAPQSRTVELRGGKRSEIQFTLAGSSP
ncbi:MAG: eukaryotic-like serine/threonine-protein kinase [Candidatus Binatota bacterium]|nr:eukaryotic-like serine/threonine-protein kinase [Candidatus Binatota bacterium]